MKGFKVALVAALAVGGSAKTDWQQYTTAVGGPGFRTQLGTGITLTIESHPQDDHAMKVDRLFYDPVQNVIILNGNLAHDVTEGDIAKRIGLAEVPAHFSAFERLKSKVAFHYAVGQKARTSKEPLCQHLGRQRCPLKAGRQSISLALGQLPELALVGKYFLEANMTDMMGTTVAKVQAHLDVPQRTKAETQRLLWETSARRLCSGGGASPSCHICEGKGVNEWSEFWPEYSGHMFYGRRCGEIYEWYMNGTYYYNDEGGCADQQRQFANGGCCEYSCDDAGWVTSGAQLGAPGTWKFALTMVAALVATASY